MLPYSLEVLFAIHGQFNRAVWPVQLLFFAFAVSVSVLLLRAPGSRVTSRATNVLLALAWAWTGIGFHWLHFASFNFAAPYYAVAFICQAGLFGLAAMFGKPRYCQEGGPQAAIGWGLVIYALLGYPLVDSMMGQAWQNVRLFALSPGATLLFSLGILLRASGRMAYVLWVIPVVWGIVAGVLAWWLGLAQDAILPVASVSAAILFLVSQRRR